MSNTTVTGLAKKQNIQSTGPAYANDVGRWIMVAENAISGGKPGRNKMHISCLSGQSPHLTNLCSTYAVPTTRSLQKALCAPPVDVKTPLFLNVTYELNKVRPQVNLTRSFQQRYRFYMSSFHNLRHVVMPENSNDAV
jgi:hypothetical protein